MEYLQSVCLRRGGQLPFQVGATLLKVTIENVCTRSFHISGLYFPSSRKDIPAEYRGIGVRIEDDVLITSDSYENLTASCPKSVTDIEKLMNSK